MNRPTFGELAGGANITRDKIGNRAANRLAAEVHQQDRTDGIRPAQIDHRTAGEHDRDIRIHGGNAPNQRHLVLRHGEGLAVKPFGLIAIRQAGIDQHDVFISREVASLSHQRFIGRIGLFAVACGIACVKPALLQLFQRRIDDERLYLAAARALIARGFGKRAEHGNGLPGGKWKQRLLVFEQHRRLRGGFSREGVVCLRVKRRRCTQLCAL